MADLYALTEQDLKTLKDVIDLVRGNRYGRGTTSLNPRYVQAPEVYIARTPVAGIPALSGTTPGSADCDIYEIDDGDLIDTNYNEVVYNLGTSAIAGSRYLLIQRDKFGHWFADQTGVTVEEVDGSPSLTSIGKILIDQADGFSLSQPVAGTARIDFTGASGTITVREEDGTPSFGSITTIRFDQADGFVITNPTAGHAKVDVVPATASQAGIISTAAQTIGGAKTFNSLLTISDGANGLRLTDAGNNVGSLFYFGADTNNYMIQLRAWQKSPNTPLGSGIILNDNGLNLVPTNMKYGVNGTYGLNTIIDFMRSDGVTPGSFTVTGGIITAET